MRDDIRNIVNMLISSVDGALLGASDEEYIEAMEELASIFEASADAKREELRMEEQS